MKKLLISIAEYLGVRFSGYGGTQRRKFIGTALAILALMVVGQLALMLFLPQQGFLQCAVIILMALYIWALVRLMQTTSNPFMEWALDQKTPKFTPQEIDGTLKKLERPCLSLIKEENSAKLGASKIGGMPDLPPGMDWPIFKGRPLSFIAQVRLSDLADKPIASILPAAGMLFFFYDQGQTAWGFDPKDKGFSRILFTPDESGLSRRSPPEGLSPDAQFKEAAVGFYPGPSYPFGESDAWAGISDGLADACRNKADQSWGSLPRHQLFGCADPIQGDMMLECQLVTHGLYCGNATGYQDPRAKELAQSAKDWKLLLQIDSDDELNMMWGDVGRLYFCATDAMLRERRFEDTWMVFQCG